MCSRMSNGSGFLFESWTIFFCFGVTRRLLRLRGNKCEAGHFGEFAVFFPVRSIFHAILFTVCYATQRLTVETPLVGVVVLRLRRRRAKSIMCSFKNV